MGCGGGHRGGHHRHHIGAGLAVARRVHVHDGRLGARRRRRCVSALLDKRIGRHQLVEPLGPAGQLGTLLVICLVFAGLIAVNRRNAGPILLFIAVFALYWSFLVFSPMMNDGVIVANAQRLQNGMYVTVPDRPSHRDHADGQVADATLQVVSGSSAITPPASTVGAAGGAGSCPQPDGGYRFRRPSARDGRPGCCSRSAIPRPRRPS